MSTLVDTSVWIDHLRSGSPMLRQLLDEDVVLCHPLKTHKLFGQGLGWIDVHLLASTLLQQVTLWTLDQPLQHAARKLQCSFESPRRISQNHPGD